MARRRRTTKLTWQETWPIWLTLAGLLGVGALALWLFVPAAPPTKMLGLAEDAAVPLASLELNTPVLFTAPLPFGNTVNFFVQRSSANSITVAFSSCRRCYSSGHYMRAGQIFCGRCNEPMPNLASGESPRLEKDCKRIPIAFDRSAEQIVVRAQNIANAFERWYAPVVPAKGGAN